ncbi:MAG: sulfatase-like hydrolase/transferase [Candidatus Micrarchaeota archaeon]|nr:sulfatase-like hydrolase/transferase [Candidatus Micrarchaeota archaeon]MDE1851456.1 sulfatase-like hydrolase/transferase [Candidatus Micrarchaeota archaeon]
MERRKKPNIIMIMLDTFRADYLSDYGGEKRLQFIESIASKSTVYKNSYAPGTYTVPSHAALFLNKRVVDIRSVLEGHRLKLSVESTGLPQYIKKGDKTLASKLLKLGYETALFSSNPFIAERTGFGEGFAVAKDTEGEKAARESGKGPGMADRMLNSEAFMRSVQFASHVIRGKMLDKLFVDFTRRMERQLASDSGYAGLDMGAAMLEEMVASHLKNSSASRPKFMFLNYMEAHEPYPISKDDIIQGRWLYMGGLLALDGVKDIKEACFRRLVYLDDKIKKLFTILEDRGFLDNAVVIITSDHGQAFMEHGQMYHDLLPYEEMVRIPIIVGRFSGGRQIGSRTVTENPTSLLEMHRYILDLANGGVVKTSAKNVAFSDHIGTARWWGSDIVKKLRDKSSGFARINSIMELSDTKATAVYYKHYKLIHYYGKRHDELFDLLKDRAEVDNIIDKGKRVYAHMLKLLK